MKTKTIFNPLSGTFDLIRSEDIPIYLNETSTIADFQVGRTHYYIGETAITYDYDLEPYPLPTSITGFNFVNLSTFDVTFNSDSGNSFYALKPTQSLQDIQVTDNGGVWAAYPTVYFDNLYDFQQVTNKGAVTTNAPIVRNNPDTYRTRYSITGQQIQRDDLGYQINYVENGIIKTATGTKSWEFQTPDLTGNTNGSSFAVGFRPNVSGTVALLSDIPAPLTSEQIQDAAFAILTDTATIDLNYDDNLNQVTATVIDNSITNKKLAKMPALTVIANEFDTTQDAQYVLLRPSMLGTTFLQPVFDINLIEIDSQRTITDVRISTTSYVEFSLTSNGVITSVPIRVTKNNGNVIFRTGQVGDTAEFDYKIIF